jgi:hypothetical protein
MPPALIRTIAAAFLFALGADATPTIVVPNFPDLTIKTRVRIGPVRVPTIHTTTWFFKGARVREERRDERDTNQPPAPLLVSITQCDRKAYYFLDEHDLKYTYSSIPEGIAERRNSLSGEPGAGELLITYDSVDTGERRQIGSYEARHIKTTATFEPSDDAGMQPGKIQLDGWYIDLPGWDMCQDTAGKTAYALEFPQKRPRIVERQRGARRGFPITEAATATPGIQTETIEYLGISDEPLSPELFRVPKDYTREYR